MGRVFVSASTTRCEVDSAPVTAAPLTMAAWLRRGSGAAGTDTAVWLGDKDAGVHWFFLGCTGTGVAVAQARDATTSAQAGLTTLTTNTWAHFCGVFASSTSRSAYTNGVFDNTNTTSVTPLGADRVSIGRLARSSPADYWDGDIAEVGIWNVALTAAEIRALAGGVPPSMVRPEALVFYAPLYGQDSPEPDYTSGGRDLTVTSATAGPHPPVNPYLITPMRYGRSIAAAAAAQRLLASTGVGS